jgi:hypothetical protein
MRKWEDLKEDTGKSGVRNVHWKIEDTAVLAPNVKKITVLIK